MVEEIIRSNDLVGESPSWFEDERRLYWVSIPDGIIHRYDIDRELHEKRQLPVYVSSIVPYQDGSAVITSGKGIYRFDFLDSKTHLIKEIVPWDIRNRMNDAKCDPDGRLWIGFMNLSKDLPTGSLFVLDKSLNLKRVIDNLTVSNGLAWNAKSSEMYHIDTPTCSVSIFSYHSSSLDIRKKGSIDLSAQKGRPDGMTIDDKGFLWVAMYNGAKVIRCDPRSREVVDSLDLPTPYITSCCFGGSNMNTLFITSSNKPFEGKSTNPYAGSLFAERLNVSGSKSYPFG
jgi:sugar lactone lactonase YvrE